MTDWEARYQQNETPWDKGLPHPSLVAFLREHPLRGRVLVPGCGLGHDVRAIAATADEVIGLDIAPSAIAGARQYGRVGGESYILGDLFTLPAKHHAAYDAVFEHTCFCAIPPEKRDAYVQAVASALKPGGLLFGIFFLTPEMEPGESGPPFGTSLEELDLKFNASFQPRAEWAPTATFPGREGREMCRIYTLRSSI